MRHRETRGLNGFLGGDRVAKVMLKVEMDGWVRSKLLNNFIMYLNIGDIKEKHNQENKQQKKLLSGMNQECLWKIMES